MAAGGVGLLRLGRAQLRQGEAESRALFQPGAFGPDAAAVRFYDAGGYPEAEPGPAATCLGQLGVLLEQKRKLIRRNPHASVANAHND